MPAHDGLYQDTLAQIKTATAGHGLRATTHARLALLVSGIMTAESCVLARVATRLWQQEVTGASCAEHVGRRMRRALNDPGLTLEDAYQPGLRLLVDWDALRRDTGQAILIVDESSQAEHVHLVRVSLAYRGTSLPLAWAIWEQNATQAPGAYWRAIDTVFASVARLLPAGLAIVVLADRAYDVPDFIDRVTDAGWDYVVRVKARSAMRVRDRRGREQAISALTAQHLARPGQRWKIRGQAFKDANWRTVSLVGHWAVGHAEPLVVMTNRAPGWAVLGCYERRFWIEPGFRNDKSAGWQWEASQVRDLARQGRLLVALAWATLLTVLLGCADAEERLAERQRRPPQTRPRPGKPPAHPRLSLFRLGLQAIGGWLIRRTPLRRLARLPRPSAPSWADEWRYGHYWRPRSQTVRP